MNILNMVSLLLEIATIVLGLKMALADKKVFGWLFALTFAIYVVYDLSRFKSYALPAHDLLFLIASLSVFTAVLLLAKKK